MFTHDLKMARRNLGRHCAQTLISIIGLAIGFTAFSFTASWIRYEKTFDTRITDADRIYLLIQGGKDKTVSWAMYTQIPLSHHLETNYPEVEAATGVFVAVETIKTSATDSLLNIKTAYADSSFFKVFYPEWQTRRPRFVVDGSFFLSDKLIADNNLKGKITNENYIGSLPDVKHTNIDFQALKLKSRLFDLNDPHSWQQFGSLAFVKIRKGVDVKAFERKISSLGSLQENAPETELKMIPLKKMHYTQPLEQTAIRYNHLRIFAVVSLLVTLGALFNFLMLFINSIKLRSRELTLRKANGAGEKNLLQYLFTEYLLLILISLFFGLMLSELLFVPFAKFSLITANRGFFFKMSLLYVAGVLILSFLAGWLPIRHFMRRGIQEILRPAYGGKGFKNSFTVISLWAQLSASILLIFCTMVMTMQLIHLNNNESAGFDRMNTHTVYNFNFDDEDPVTGDEIRSIAGVTDVIYFPQIFLPQNTWSTIKTTENNKSEKPRTVIYQAYDMGVPEDFIRFFKIKLVAGRCIHKGEEGACLINQAALKEWGEKDPVGKKLAGKEVVGIIEDFYTASPTQPVSPTIYYGNSGGGGSVSKSFAFRCEKKDAPRIYEEIEKAYRKRGNYVLHKMYSMEEVYRGYMKSERYLLYLLSVMTGVAVLIAVFGIYSMITLSCNRRRKEIAIRKINGAGVREVMMLFFRQYFYVILCSVFFALPVGYYIMQRWVEQYTRQVTAGIWSYLSIITVVFIVVYMSIFSRVFRAARQNPAKTLKSE